MSKALHNVVVPFSVYSNGPNLPSTNCTNRDCFTGHYLWELFDFELFRETSIKNILYHMNSGVFQLAKFMESF
jgi:hypothetical protein